MGYFGLDYDTLELCSLPVQFAGMAVAFLFGLFGSRRGLVSSLIGLGILVNLVAMVICAGGGEGACVGFVGFPIICLVFGYLGRGVRRLLGMRMGRARRVEEDWPADHAD